MMDQVRDLDDHITTLQTEVNAHASEIAVSADPGVAMAAEGGHRDRMLGHMRLMRFAMDDLGTCSRQWQGRADYLGLADDISAVEQEYAKHQTAVGKLTDLGAIRAEEVRHRSWMSGMFEPMRIQQRSMMSSGLSSGCCGSH